MAQNQKITADSYKQTGLFSKFLKFVEWLGNLLPHPVTLFMLFALGTIILSGILDWLELAVLDPRPVGSKARAADGMIRVVSLLSTDGLRRIIGEMVRNFTNFVPLGTVLVAMLGVGVAEQSGLLTTLIRTLVFKAPRYLITYALVFAGVISNTASEVGYVVLIPLAGYLFMTLGRHPIAGMAAAFAGVSGGYSANLFIGTVDPLLAGITQEAAQLIAPDYTIHPAINWYFMMISTLLITFLGGLITNKIVEPNLGKYDPSIGDGSFEEANSKLRSLTTNEKKGLKYAALTLLICVCILALTIVPEWGVLRHPQTKAVLGSPFLKGIVVFILVLFLFPSVVYGKIVGTIKNDKDIIDGMAKAMSNLGLYIVLVFFAAQFVAYFKWTNLGSILAVLGADFLQGIGATGIFIFLPFVILCGIINFALGSASAQWAVTAPIFVPLLMLLGYAPEVIQAAYRIGDSATNIITPMMSYFGLILAFASKFDRKIKVGTVISTMLPYSIIFMLGWISLFYVWIFVLGLPVGPEAPTYFTPK